MGSKVYQITMTDKAYEILAKTAEIRGIDPLTLMQSEFKSWEELAGTLPHRGLNDFWTLEKLVEEHYKREHRMVLRKAFKEVCKKFPWKEYIIHKDAKGVRTELGWRMCPIMDHGEEWYPADQKNHIGEYYLRLQKSHMGSGSLPISFIQSTEYEYYPTLKRLKKAINRILKQYGHSEMYVTKRTTKTEV